MSAIRRSPKATPTIDFPYSQQSLLKEKLGDVLTSLTERERRILEMRFGLVDGYERTLEEIARCTM